MLRLPASATDVLLEYSELLIAFEEQGHRCICFNVKTSAMVVVGHGVRGNHALCSIAVAVDLRKSIVMRHVV